jgi:hypothetical protein
VKQGSEIHDHGADGSYNETPWDNKLCVSSNQIMHDVIMACHIQLDNVRTNSDNGHPEEERWK